MGASLVIGTTGYDDAQQDQLAAYAAGHAVVHAANFSVGVPALQMLLQLLAAHPAPGFRRRADRDPPCHEAGPAQRHGAEPRGDLGAGPGRRRAADPQPADRGRRGEHTWTFADAEETIVVTHRAHSRQAFLRGVLPSVRFAARAEPGLYDLGDVLQGLGED